MSFPAIRKSCQTVASILKVLVLRRELSSRIQDDHFEAGSPQDTEKGVAKRDECVLGTRRWHFKHTIPKPLEIQSTHASLIDLGGGHSLEPICFHNRA